MTNITLSHVTDEQAEWLRPVIPLITEALTVGTDEARSALKLREFDRNLFARLTRASAEVLLKEGTGPLSSFLFDRLIGVGNSLLILRYTSRFKEAEGSDWLRSLPLYADREIAIFWEVDSALRLASISLVIPRRVSWSELPGPADSPH
jgi:hypothetical protein